jgi:hypothetical protein
MGTVTERVGNASGTAGLWQAAKATCRATPRRGSACYGISELLSLNHATSTVAVVASQLAPVSDTVPTRSRHDPDTVTAATQQPGTRVRAAA